MERIKNYLYVIALNEKEVYRQTKSELTFTQRLNSISLEHER